VNWDITVVEETGSTNADLLEDDGQEGAVLVARHQTAGRGRLGRTWLTPKNAALTFSVRLRPDMPVARLGWLPLAAGVAVAEAVRDECALTVSLKWPNDVLHHQRKLAGILAEQSASGAIVVGIGLNMSATEDELPPSGPGGLVPTSLAIVGRPDADRDALLTAILDRLGKLYDVLQAGGEIRDDYLAWSGTLGQSVRIELPGDRSLTGTATGIDEHGRLLITGEDDQTVAVSAGDVVHLRHGRASRG
jgi:BirA family transcriptional regulator, biotin operon repressor / biotin---[acetyl-CoA-carboxylase] ligase